MALSSLLAVPSNDDLTLLSVDELGTLTISAAAKHSQPLFETPAAVSVLRSADLLRDGYASIADALRLIPGVHVASINQQKWAIGVRGFNGITSTKLLVVVDGRNVYSPFYAGVEWAEANLPPEDVEHVEVVRGPGATLWGVNAVNGIVSITSKSARDTQGALVSLRSGSGEGTSGYVRYGGVILPKFTYRVFASAQDTDNGLHLDSGAVQAQMRQMRAGVRLDDERRDGVRFTWQGDYYFQKNFPPIFDPVAGVSRVTTNQHYRLSLLGRMVWKPVGDDEVTVQVYVDRARDRSGGYQSLGVGQFGLGENGDTFDLDFNHHLKIGERNDFIWGGGVRGARFDIAASGLLVVADPTGTSWRYNLFAQDEVTLLPERVKLTLGSKFEHHDTVAWQALPSARIVYTPSRHQTWWGAVSRAVRAPSRSERDVRFALADIPASPYSPATHVDLVGTPATREEVLTAYEIGWRVEPVARLTFDLTAYRHEYTQLRDLAPRTSFVPVPPHVQVDLLEVNSLSAIGYGFEGEVNWRASDRWRLGFGLTDERLNPATTPSNVIIAGDFSQPKLMWNIHTWVELPRDWEFSAALYRVSAPTFVSIPAYVRADAQLTWRPRPDLEFNLGVQNAGDPHHPEFSAISTYPTTEAPRNFFARVQWRF